MCLLHTFCTVYTFNSPFKHYDPITSQKSISTLLTSLNWINKPQAHFKDSKNYTNTNCFINTLNTFNNFNNLQTQYCQHVLAGMVFCYQNCSDLLWEKYVLVIENIFWNLRLKAVNLQNFETAATIYSNSERSVQFLKQKASWLFPGGFSDLIHFNN